MSCRGLLVGRFQPFHNGHLYVIRKILEQVDEVIITVGSAQHSHTVEDPFTAGERIDMIRQVLIGQHTDPLKYLLIPVTDLNDNRLWVSHITSLVPHFHVVFTNKPLVKILFSDAGYEVRPIAFYRRDVYSGTEVRKRIIRSDAGWKDLVPKEVVDFINSIKGVERLKALAQSDADS